MAPKKTSLQDIANLAQEGDAKASAAVALVLETGLEGEYSPEKAIGYWETAAASGDAMAVKCLSDLYENGPLELRDEKKLQHWNQKLRELGYMPNALLINSVQRKSPDQPMRVLVVDEDLVFCETIGYALKENALINEFMAQNGLDAIKQIVALRGVDIVIADMKIGKMSALELFKVVRQQDSLKDIPLVVMTSDQNFKLSGEWKALRVSDVLYKPVSISRFQGMLSVVLALDSAS